MGVVQFPKFLYHAEHAKEGRLFQSEADLPTDLTGWHDTPAKFDPTYVPPPESPVEDGRIPDDARRAGFVPIPYPAHLYQQGDHDHPRLVASAEAHAQLEAEQPGVWKDTPDPKAWDAAAVAAKAAAGAGDPVPDPKATAVVSDAQRAEFYAATIAQIVQKLDGIGDVPLLLALRAAEEANPHRRVGVLKAIKARLADLKVEHA